MFSTTLSSSAHSRATDMTQTASSQPFGTRKNARFVPAIMALLALCSFALLSSSSAQAQNTISTVAGGGTPATQALLADLPSPAAVVEDANGNVYISPPNSYYIFKQTPAGGLSIYAGIGIFGGGGNNGPAAQAGLGGVMALALDSQGDLYLSDKGTNSIRCIIAVAGGCSGSALPVGDIVTVVNTSGQTCFPAAAVCGDGGPAINAQISYPEGLFIDSANNIWMTDTYDFRIRCVVGTAGGCDQAIFGTSYPVGDIMTVAGTGQFCDGPTFPCGNGGPALQAFFDLPNGIVVDAAGNFYIADTRDFTVRCVIAVAGGCGGSKEPVGNVDIFAGSVQFCPDPTKPCGDGGPAIGANLWNPAGLSFDKAGDLYIADASDNRIRCVVAVTRGCGGSPLPVGDITTVAGDGNQGFAGDTGKARSAWLNLPNGVFVDSKGNIFIADTGNQRIREVVSEHINTTAGGGPNGDGGTATSATLANPNTVTWDSAGNYYIADAANNQIRKVTPAGVISTIAGTGIAGPPNATPVAATSATLNNPEGVSVDAANNVYIADTLNQVIRCILAVNGGCGGSTAAVGDIVTVAGNGNTCKPNNGPCGNGGPAVQGQLTEPTSVAVDSNGNMYIADHGAHRIRCVLGIAGGCGGSTYAVGDITNTAGTGAKGFTGNGGPAVKARLSRANGVAVDSFGNVYIADSPNNQIRCVIEVKGGCGGSSLPVGDIVAFAFTGKPSCKGDGGAALTATMNNPLEVVLDPSNNVFVSGGSDNIVRRIDAVSLTVTTVAGNIQHCQQAGFAGDGGPATKAVLDNVGSAIDGKGDLLIADSGNNRIREVTLAPVAKLSTKTLTFPSEPIGQSSAPMPVTLTNTGYADLPISGVQIQGLDTGDFSISSNSCGAQLAPVGSCSISVVFTPSKAGKRTAKIVITDSLGQQTVNLVGTGQ
jgi:sugar lactone lactonase YvrE